VSGCQRLYASGRRKKKVGRIKGVLETDEASAV